MGRNGIAVLSAGLCALLACGGESAQPNQTNQLPVNANNGMQPKGGTGGSSTNGAAGGSAGSGMPMGMQNQKPPMQMQMPPPSMTTAGSMAMMPMQTAGSKAPPMLPPAGPEDGDPSKPMVSIPGIPCGVPRAGFGATPPSVKITNRDVVVAYPCAHEGAPVTFFLFLHGTLSEEIKVGFTMNAWPIHELVDSHNVIVVVPKAVGQQWGNGDNGADKPHLYEVVDWVYATFGEKFSIRSMWAQGGSWGAFYLSSQFACDPRFEDKLKGIQLVVGGGCPACSNRLSCMVLQQELEKGMGMPLDDAAKEKLVQAANIQNYATMHGCDARTGPEMVGATRYWGWPNCDAGWTHSYYLGPGQHADAWDKMAVLKATEAMKATEPP